MSTYLGLAATAIFPVIVSVVMYMFERSEKNKLSYKQRQLLYGIVFGIVAISGTEFGIDIEGAVINVRDAGPLCAGLIFGAPAGMISGLIGGIERWLAVYWGAGEYTRLACSVSTILAGFYGAGIRRRIFDDKKPSWHYGLLAGISMETFHMLMVFITNMDDISTAFAVVEVCSVPMISLTGFAVMASVFIVNKIGQKGKPKHQLTQISQSFQRGLAVMILSAFLVTTSFSWILQTRLSNDSMQNLLLLNVEDVHNEILDASNANLLRVSQDIVKKIDTENFSNLYDLAEEYNVSGINVVNEDGIITHSTVEGFVDFDMYSGDQAREFTVLLHGEKTYVQQYGPLSIDSSIYRKYAGIALEDGGFIQVGYDAERFQQDIASHVVDITKNRHIGEEGQVLISDLNGNIVSSSRGNEGKIADTGFTLTGTSQGEFFLADIYGVPSYCYYQLVEGYCIIASIPMLEAFFMRNVSVHLTVFIEIVIFAMLFIQVYYLIKKLVVDNVKKINGYLEQITKGNLDVVVDVRTNKEFASLSDDINSTVVTLKKYIDEAAARIDQELEYAKDIQMSSLPNVFPAYPNRTEFNIHAMMRPAKEVGGDFYDFYLLGDSRIAFLIADVSGKGIPAAMFMMRAKTLLKTLAETGMDLDEVFMEANNQLCESNDAGMFVTAWMGIADLNTGIITYANAGHNPPVICRKGGEPEFLTCRPGFVLAGMENVKYKKQELKMAAGDIIYLYTDGINEATDANDELYGNDRLLSAIKENRNSNIQELCTSITEDVDTFVGEAPQFDDMTMLAFRVNGDAMKEIKVEPKLENVRKVTEFIEDEMTANYATPKAIAQMNVAIDEIFSNIANYSNATEVWVGCRINKGKAALRFEDDGIAYDPTIKADPDVTLSAEEREIGGLGIFMVKKSMDVLRYEYVNKRNILILEKTW